MGISIKPEINFMKYHAVLEVDLNLIKENCKRLKTLAKGSFFCPMLKAEAYGHGALPVAQALFDIGVKQVGVFSADEAWPIREALPSMDILIFSPLPGREDLSWILEENLIIVCCHWQDLKKISQHKRPARIHLKFDTGFSRLGFDLKDSQKLFDFLKAHPQIQLEGLATQLVSGEELGDKNSFSFHQLNRFYDLKKIFPRQNFHAFNTVALISSFAHQSQMPADSRPGIGLYGVKPKIFLKNKKAEERYQKLSLSPVSCLKAQIVAVRHISKGTGVSYGGVWKASRPSQIATVSLGYGDGFFRGLHLAREVLFRGKKRAIVGAVCMDFFMIDVTDCGKEKSVELGEEVIIFGQSRKLYLSVQDQAEVLNTIPYELFSRLGPRVKRVYKS